MPNIDSAKKRMRQDKKRHARNKWRKQRVREQIKTFLEALRVKDVPFCRGRIQEGLLDPRQGFVDQHHAQEHGRSQEEPACRPTQQSQSCLSRFEPIHRRPDAVFSEHRRRRRSLCTPFCVPRKQLQHLRWPITKKTSRSIKATGRPPEGLWKCWSSCFLSSCSTRSVWSSCFATTRARSRTRPTSGWSATLISRFPKKLGLSFPPLVIFVVLLLWHFLSRNPWRPAWGNDRSHGGGVRPACDSTGRLEPLRARASTHGRVRRKPFSGDLVRWAGSPCRSVRGCTKNSSSECSSFF